MNKQQTKQIKTSGPNDSSKIVLVDVNYMDTYKKFDIFTNQQLSNKLWVLFTGNRKRVVWGVGDRYSNSDIIKSIKKEIDSYLKCKKWYSLYMG